MGKENPPDQRLANGRGDFLKGKELAGDLKLCDEKIGGFGDEYGVSVLLEIYQDTQESFGWSIEGISYRGGSKGNEWEGYARCFLCESAWMNRAPTPFREGENSISPILRDKGDDSTRDRDFKQLL